MNPTSAMSRTTALPASLTAGSTGVCLLAALMPLQMACAQTVTAPATPPAAQTPGQDPFGDGDPFEVVKRTAIPAAKTGNGAIDIKTSLFLKLDANDVRSDANLNPDNRNLHLKQQQGIVEARTTASSTIDVQRQWRWLFKGFASSSDFRQGDGVIGNHLRTDELFVDWKGKDWFASLGKRRVNWGHAQGFNLVNVVAPARDPLNPDYETEGQPMLWLSHSGSTTADLIYTRGNYRDDGAGSGSANLSGDKARWGWRWSVPKNDADMALYYFDGAAYADGRPFDRMLGASFSASVIPGLSLYGELARFSHNYRHYYDDNGQASTRDGASSKAVFGALLDLGEKSSLFAEAFYNGQGTNARERQNYWRAAAYKDALLGEFASLAMNRRYVLVGYKKEYREKYALNLNFLAAADRSTTLRVEGTYLLSDYFDLKAVFSHSSGPQDSEFRNNPFARQFELQLSTHF